MFRPSPCPIHYDRHLATLSSADFCLINQAIANLIAVGFPFYSFSFSQWVSKEPRQFLRHALVRIFRLPVKQISPDKNVNGHCTASSFTVSLESVGFVILGSLTPETQPFMMFLFVSAQFCARASSPQILADLQLPSASRYNLRYHSDEVGSPTEDFHLISSRPCWAYQVAPADNLKWHFFCIRKNVPL